MRWLRRTRALLVYTTKQLRRSYLCDKCLWPGRREHVNNILKRVKLGVFKLRLHARKLSLHGGPVYTPVGVCTCSVAGHCAINTIATQSSGQFGCRHPSSEQMSYTLTQNEGLRSATGALPAVILAVGKPRARSLTTEMPAARQLHTYTVQFFCQIYILYTKLRSH